MSIAYLSYVGLMALCIALAAWTMWRRQWSWIGLYVAFGCLFGGLSKHEHWIRMLFDPDYSHYSPPPEILLVWPHTPFWAIISAISGLAYAYAMVGSLRPSGKAANLLLAAISVFQMVLTGWGISYWIAQGGAPQVSFGNVLLPGWISLILLLAVWDLPFVCALPFAIARLFESGDSAAGKIFGRFGLIFGIVLVGMTLLSITIFTTTVRTAQLVGYESTGSQEFVGLALLGLLGLLGLSLLEFRRSFLQPAMALLQGAGSIETLAEMPGLSRLWQALARLIDDSRNAEAKAINELVEARAQLAGFFEHIPVAMSLHSLDGQFVFGTDHVRASYGLSAEELRERSVQSLSHFWPEFDKLAAATAKVVATGKMQRLLTPFQPQGESIPHVYDVVVFPVFGADGTIIQIGSLGIDVTAQHDAEAALAEREAQLTALIEHAPVAIALSDMSGKHHLANRAVEQLYGISEAELMEKPGNWLFEHFENFEDLAVNWGELVKIGKPMRVEAVFRPENRDEPRILDLIAFPIRGADGSLSQVGSIAIDVTDQQRGQQELDRSRSTLQAFFENIPAMTFIIGPDRNYVTANSYAIDNYGFEFLSPANLIGRSDLTGTPDHWHPIIAEAHRTVMEDGKPHEVETSIDMPGGTLSLYVSRFPIRNAEGEVTHVGGLIFDRTAERRASDQVAATREALHQSEKLAALGQLLAGVAHELNNPLTVVVGRSAILEEKLKETPHGKAIADLREAADRCNRIVRTFLAMARQSAPRRAAVQVNDAIEAALDMTAYGLRSSGIELVRKLDTNLPEVEADEDQLVQVFTNLLINARHALEEHRPEGGKVTIATRTRDGKLLVEIADNGPGVPAELAGRIFEPFFTTKAVGEGTGMGLAMSRGMIEEHGGKLLYSDARDGGAAFTVELPIATALASAKPEDDGELPHRKGRGRVLVIDDEPTIRGLLVEILEGIDLDCVECGDGAAALRLLDHQTFDLVFCDVRMPVMDGIRFRQHLAETHPALLDRLVFISGDVLQRGHARRAEIAGHAFVEKPFNPTEVRKLALSLLDGQGDTP